MKSVLILLFSSLYVFSFAQELYEHNETYKVNPTGSLYLNTDDADIKIVGVDRNDVSIDVYRKVIKKGMVKSKDVFVINYELKDGNLHVEEESSSSYSVGFGYLSIDYKIYIEVPMSLSLDIIGDDDDYEISNIEGNIKLNCEDGDVLAKYCSSDNFQLHCEDGDVVIDGLDAKNIELITEDGDIAIKNSSTEFLDCIAEDGDMIIDLKSAVNAKIRVSDGDVIFTNRKSTEVSKFNISHEDGDIDLFTGFVSDLYIRGEDGDIKTNCSLTPDAKIGIKIGDGDVDFIVDEGFSYYELYTNDGDINYPRSFDVIKDKSSYKSLKSGESNAYVEIESVDGDIVVR